MAGIEVLIPLVIPFVIGLIVGLLVRTLLKVAIAILALAILLPYAGCEGFPSIEELFSNAQKNLPTIVETGRGWLDSLPYTTPAFIIGVLVGIYWGG